MKLHDTDIKAQLKSRLGLDPATSKIVVVGLGVTGVSVARFLSKLGFSFVIADSRERPPGLIELHQELGNVSVITGTFDRVLFRQSSHLIVSPGISLAEKTIADALAKGVNVIGDIDLFACSTADPIVAITGSNGKSTVTTMLGEMAVASGKKVAVGGNLGLAALDLLYQDAELYVLELSSFQLERTSQLNAAAATVLNVTADHLDRHADLADYAAQKQRVFLGDGAMVINVDDPIVAAMKADKRRTLTFSIQYQADFWLGNEQDTVCLMYGETRLLAVTDVPLEGKHNAANALAALALGVSVGLDVTAMTRALKSFKGLPHRMQRVAEIDGITWVNDSKATNIGSCVAALQGYDRKVVLIAGGDAKGADMAELVPAVKEKAQSVILMGKDAGLIERALNGYVPVQHAANMVEAVNIAARIAHFGDTILLSPACASLDQYQNYQDRGQQFAKAVLALKSNNAALPSTARMAL